MRADVKGLLDRVLTAAAMVIGPRLDVLSANRLARQLHPRFATGRNLVRDLFLDSDLGHVALQSEQRRAVAALRSAFGQEPQDPRLVELIEQLASQSKPFAAAWAQHEVRAREAVPETKRFRHPVIGGVELVFTVLDVPGAARQQVAIYSDVPGQDTVRRLAEEVVPTA